MSLVGAVFERYRFLRYLVVGALNTGVSYGVYALMLWCGLEYRLASLCALFFGVFWSYTTQRAMVFSASRGGTLVSYVIVWTCLYFLNVVIIGYLKRYAFNEYVAGALAALPVTVTSYFLLKIVVFPNAKSGIAHAPHE